jgi:putative endonuclease
MTYYAYIVECANGSYYTGWTDDVARRVASHNTGEGAKYTRAHRPVVLVAYWEFASRSEAMKEERRIKRLSRRQKQLLLQSFERPVDGVDVVAIVK